MRRVLLLVVVLAGCRSPEPAAPSDPTGAAPLQVTQGPPPGYWQVDNVDSTTSLRNRR